LSRRRKSLSPTAASSSAVDTVDSRRATPVVTDSDAFSPGTPAPPQTQPRTRAATGEDGRAGRAEDRPARAVSGRAVFIGLLLAAVLCAVTPYNDFKVGATYIAGTQFPIGSLFVLLVFAGVINVALRRWAPRAAFARGELLTIWSLITVASGLPSSGLMRYFLPHLAAPTALSNTTNNWEYRIWGKTPLRDWLFVTDKPAADAFFQGYPRGSEHIPWEAWVRPLAAWGLLAVCFLSPRSVSRPFCGGSGSRTRSSPSRSWPCPC
jgi:hypothetical protein